MKFQDAAMNYVFYPYTWAILAIVRKQRAKTKKKNFNRPKQNSLHGVHILLWSDTFRFLILNIIVVFVSE